MNSTEVFDVFVSYARADLRSDHSRRRSLARVVEALRRQGLRVFLDTTSLDDFVWLNQTIASAIARSRSVLVWYSPTYPTRPACRAELTVALLADRTTLDEAGSLVLAINTESDIKHIVHAEILGRNFLKSPDDSDANAISALAEKIAASVAQRPAPAVLIERRAPEWLPSRVSSSPRFVGRQREIWEIDALLWPERVVLSQAEPGSARRAVAVAGLPGVGKTQLAMEYASLLGPVFPAGIFWLSAGGHDAPGAEELERRRESAFRNIAILLHINPERMPLNEVRAEIAGRMAKKGAPCLWIVDDLPPGLDQAAVEKWIGPDPARTLITTQWQKYDFLETLSLGPLEMDEAVALLTRDNAPSTTGEAEAARSIVNDLDCHPLAVDLARAYLQHRPSYQNFVDSLKVIKPGSDLLERAGIFSNNQSIQLTMLSSFSLLDDDGLAALRFACTMPALPVPEAFMRSFSDDAADPTNPDIERGIEMLLDLSLAHRVEPGVVELHSLVNRSERLLETESIESLRPTVAARLFKVLDGLSLARLASVRHEARLARAFAGELVTMADLWVHRVALTAETLAGALRSTLPGWRLQVEAADRIAGPASWESVRCRCHLSEVLRDLGQLDEALGTAEEALYWSERNLGWNDVYTIQAAEVVGLALAALGRRDDALKMFEQVRAAFDRLGQSGQTGVYRTISNLAVLGSAQGIEALLSDALNRADADEAALRTAIQLAPLEIAAGRAEAAVRILSKCYDRLLSLVGKRNPLTCECMMQLAYAQVAQGNLEVAESLFRDALSWYEVEFGLEHPKAMEARQDLTAVLDRRGDPEIREQIDAAMAANAESDRLFRAGEAGAALLQAESALATLCRMFGPKADTVLRMLHNVVQIAASVDVGRCAAASYELCQCLPVGDSGRPGELQTLALAAGAAVAQARAKGDITGAALWAKRLLGAQNELNGPRSSEAVVAAWNVCELLREDGKMAEGLSELIDRLVYLLAEDEVKLSPDLQQIRELVGRMTRDSRTRAGARLNNPGISDEALQAAIEHVNAASDVGRPFQAIDDLQRLADEYAVRYGSLHPDTLAMNWMLWSAVGQAGDDTTRPMAIEQLRLISKAQRAQFGDTPALLLTLQNLAGVLSLDGNSAETARIDEQCLEIARKLHGITNPATVAIAFNAADSALKVRNYTGARSIFQIYLSWLVRAEPGSLSADFDRSRVLAVALGQDLGLSTAAAGKR